MAGELATSYGHDIYTKLKGETPKAFEAWRLYRDMGVERSYRKVAQALHKSDTLIAGWASKHQWQERLVAWEEHLDQQARQEVEKQRREMVERHIKLGSAMQSIGAAKLTEWQRQIAAWQQDPANNPLPKLSAKDMATLVEAGVRIERLSRGEPTDTNNEKIIVYQFIAPKERPTKVIDAEVVDK